MTLVNYTILFSKSIRGAGRAYLLAKWQGVLVTYLSGIYYDQYKKEGLSPKDAKEAAMNRATEVAMALTATKVGLNLVTKLMEDRKKGKTDLALHLMEAGFETIMYAGGSLLGANKRIDDKILKDSLK